MKKIFVADQDDEFQAVMKSLCQKGNVDLKIYTTSMEILPLIEGEIPDLVFLSLELPDINDFVMFDLLKKADTCPPVPVLITYTTQSENQLKIYKNLKFQPQGYHKKPIKENDLLGLLSMYLGDVSNAGGEGYKSKDDTRENTALAEDDDIIFSEVLAENDMEEDPLDSLIDESQQQKNLGAVFKVSDGAYVDLKERTDERERAARLVSLEKQNHFLMTENKRLLNELNTINERPTQLETEFINRADENKKNLEYLEKLVDELNVKLTDKERELIAKDHEFEKKLRNEMDETIRETEERIRMDIGQFFKNELNTQKESIASLQQELTESREIETTLNSSIANLDHEKAALSQIISELENEKKSIMKRLMTFEIDLANLEKEKEELVKEKGELVIEKEESEKLLASTIEKSAKELELTQQKLMDYRNKFDMLSDLLQNAITLTRG